MSFVLSENLLYNGPTVPVAVLASVIALNTNKNHHNTVKQVVLSLKVLVNRRKVLTEGVAQYLFLKTSSK